MRDTETRKERKRERKGKEKDGGRNVEREEKGTREIKRQR